MIKIMFVCHGNICRSPMAEFVFKAMVKEYGIENDFIIESSATSTEEIWNGQGNPVYPPAKAELAKHGLSCENKRAVQLKKSDYDKYDLFLCMDNNNLRNAVRILDGDKENKVRKFLFDRDVSDPWYSGNFETTYNDILNGCNELLKFVLREKNK